MKIINEAANLELKLNSDTQIDLNKDELLQVIDFNLEEIDATAKLKVIKTLFATRGVQTKEDLIVEVTNFLHYTI